MDLRVISILMTFCKLSHLRTVNVDLRRAKDRALGSLSVGELAEIRERQQMILGRGS